MSQRCKEAEAKFAMVVEWVNAALLDSPAPGLTQDGTDAPRADEDANEPIIVVSSPPRPYLSGYTGADPASAGEMDDFAPSPKVGQAGQMQMPAHGTITLSRSRMTRATLGHLDIDSFNNKFGTLTVSGKGRNALGRGVGGLGGKMLRDESCFALAEMDETDEVF